MTMQTMLFTVAWTALLAGLPLWMLHDLRARRSKDELDLEPLKAYVAKRAERSRRDR